MLDKKVTTKRDRFFKNKNIRMFLVFLIISFIFWLLINLSKESISIVNFDLTYYNSPHSKIIQDTSIDELKIELKAHGFKFLSYQLNRQPIRLNLIHLKKLKNNTYYYLPNNYIRELQLQFSDDIEVISVTKDTIFFDLTTLTTKKIKVIPNLNIDFKTGYNFAKPIVITPDSIELQGPKAVLDTINGIKTVKVQFKNLAEVIKQSVSLELFKNDKIKYNQSQVELVIEVDKFTETSLLTSFTILNLPENYEISTIPKEVTIKYQVSLLNYNKVNASMFKVQCDFALSKKDSLDYLIPVVISKPDFVNMVQVAPNRIEYLLKK